MNRWEFLSLLYDADDMSCPVFRPAEEQIQDYVRQAHELRRPHEGEH